MRKRILRVLALAVVAAGIGSLSLVTGNLSEASPPVAFEDPSVETALLEAGELSATIDCIPCYSLPCVVPNAKCGAQGSKCRCSYCGGEFNCFPKH